MAITYTWTIPTTERNLSDGGITTIHWRCTGVDGDYSAASYGTTSRTYDSSSSDFIEYNDVTEANCIEWVQEDVSEAEIEAALAAKIEADKNPTSAAGTPWAA